MRIKKISHDEIMVYLTKQDLEYFDFNPADKIPQSADLHKLLFEVMELVRSETGFDPYNGGQVVVEASASSSGMNLAISKVSTKIKPMTREEFRKAKTVRVKQRKSCGSDCLSHRDIMEIIENLGIESAILEKMKKKAKNEIFIFYEFSSMESALRLLPDEVISDCALYRSEKKYAILTKLKRDSRYSNILSEFADRSTNAEIVKADICEGWELIAESEALVSMAWAIRDMQ